MRVGIIGCGAIGTLLAKAIEKFEWIEKVYLFDRSHDKAERLARHTSKAISTKVFNYFLEHTDLVVEAASQQAVHQYGETILRQGKDFMVMSIGALLDESLKRAFETLAREHGGKIYLPSGALLGIDGVKAAGLKELKEVILVTKKPPTSFRGNKYLREIGIAPGRIKEEKLLFEGIAKDAVARFPKNINVAACLSLAGIGARRTKVKIIADPGGKQNVHQVKVKGDFGEFCTETRNFPTPTNPKTSYLAALSALATIRKIVEPLQIGT